MSSEDGPQFTFRQLKIFRAVVETGSMSRAAKFLDVRQPSVSQQISRLEHTVGTKLIRYVNGELRLTPAGDYLTNEAAKLLGAVDEMSAELAAFAGGRRGELKVGTLPSLARNILMPSFSLLAQRHPGYALDIVDVTPREARAELTGRSLDAAVVSDFGIDRGRDLSAVTLRHDRQLFAVPSSLPDLSAVEDPEKELSAPHLEVLKKIVRYAFGSDHTRRVNDWYDTMAPDADTVVRCRSFDNALPFVEEGLATAIVPDLAVRQGNRPLFDVTLYELPVPARRVILLMPAQNVRLPGLVALTEVVTEVAQHIAPLETRPAPRFIARRFSGSPDRENIPMDARPAV